MDGNPIAFTSTDSASVLYAGVLLHWRKTILGWELADRLTSPAGEIMYAVFGTWLGAHDTELFAVVNDDSIVVDGHSVWAFDFTRTRRRCPSGPNSSGQAAMIDWGGSSYLRNQSFSLMAASCPSSTPGVFYFGHGAIELPFGNGTRCVGGVTYRLPVVQTDAGGAIHSPINLSAPGIPLTPGSTWNFQFWFRDPAGGGALFDLSDSIEIRFCG